MSNDLNKQISEIFRSFEGDVKEAINQAVQTTGKKAIKELKASGKFKDRSGKYRRGWKMQVEKGRLGYTATVYNEHPGKTTWLEYGHAKQNGGRTEAFPHIASVDENVEEIFLDELRKGIE